MPKSILKRNGTTRKNRTKGGIRFTNGPHSVGYTYPKTNRTNKNTPYNRRSIDVNKSNLTNRDPIHTLLYRTNRNAGKKGLSNQHAKEARSRAVSHHGNVVQDDANNNNNNSNNASDPRSP